jgi:hypothetical protein
MSVGQPQGVKDAPEFFYKYVTRRVGELILKNRTLRWSTPGTLNDPYDMQFDLRFEIDKDAVKAAAIEKLWTAFYGPDPLQIGNRLGATIHLLRSRFPRLDKDEFAKEFGTSIDQAFTAMERTLPGIQKDLREYLASCKILCLTAAPDKLLMWHRYAEGGSGMVLRFKTPPGVDSPWPTARRINYLSNMPVLVDNAFLADMLAGRVSMDHEAVMHRMVYTKSLEWAYEAEWRIFTGQGRDPKATFEDVHFNVLELDAVIFGYLMPENDRNTLTEIVRRQCPHAQLLQLRKTAQIFFRLEIVPL